MEIRTLPVGELQANCYIVYGADKRGMVIDPGGEAANIVAAVREAGVTVEHILLTHVHVDHILAAREVQQATGADLLVPEADAPALTSPSRSLVTMLYPGRRYDLTADALLRDGDTVTAGECTLQVIHTPGHTPGSSCYRGEGVLFTGDTLFAGSIGRTDFPGGDMDRMVASLQRLASLDGDPTVYPGHDAPTTLEQERRCNPYL